jgi:hypothetical protein
VMTFNETIESFKLCLSIPSNIRICSTLINLSSRWRRLCGLSRERCVSLRPEIGEGINGDKHHSLLNTVV